MSLSWVQRKARLALLLKSQDDEDAEGLALDRILHGQSVIGKTAKTTEIDAIRFQDRDLSVAGTLEYGQFGVIYVVTCRLDGRVYIRKSIEKKFALRNRDQCAPQLERDILLQAHKTDSKWAPHLLCAFQTPTHLNLVMDYAEGGNLWDVLESSPHDGKVLEADLLWWAPQLVSAIHWCHSQGFAHRDIKPHNFVLTPNAHVLLIDFGSAAPLLPPDSDGIQLLPKRYCLVPCGTCDYISPEILKAHEEALVALEMEDDSQIVHTTDDAQGYGRETDWWSLGAMLYEMAYGTAPFFAKDIRQTYLKIIDHEKCLHFDRKTPVSSRYQEFLRLLLTRADRRLGRRNIDEITNHPIFRNVDWDTLPTRKEAPPGLHLPQFTYTEPAQLAPSPAPAGLHSQPEDSHSQGFAFSALFQSSNGSSSPGLSILRSRTSPHPARPPEEDATASFIGFSWGPAADAFPAQELDEDPGHEDATLSYMNTPRPIRIPSTYLTPNPAFITPRWSARPTPFAGLDRFSTPMRPSALTPDPHATLQRTSTIRRTGERRSVSDREAMKQLVDCVGMSARKKVLESGRKPRLLTRSGSNGSLTRKELRFHPGAPIPVPDLINTSTSAGGGPGPGTASSLHSRLAKPPKPILVNHHHHQAVWSGSEDTDSEGPPSPSPTPRPGSAMSTLSRRSGTPTVNSTRMGMGMGTMSSTSTMLLGIPRSMSGRSLSFSRSMDLSASFRSAMDEVQEREREQEQEEERKEQPVRDRPTLKPRTFEEMEGRLAVMMGDIRGVEERLARVAAKVR
ncbi:kinase-like protein [Lyophyllum atratum]|nr:kinase-like protein [Lyophyllum atratum]